MELIVSLNKKDVSPFLEFTNSFIVGLKDYSVNYFELSIEEITELLNKYKDINLFVSINKNIFNKDILDLKDKLLKLSKLNIKAILYYDLSILELVRALNLNIDLCYHQTHMVTNYNICNYYFKHGVKYAYLSTELTTDEMSFIKDNTNIKLMTYFLGHVIISHSKRKLVSNFYKHINSTNNNKLNIIKEINKDNKYYCLENDLGTNILTYDVLNGTKAFILLKDKIDYGILDNNLIDDSIFLEIVKLYKMYIDKKINSDFLVEKVNNLIGDNSFFFFKKSIYKVKDGKS